MVTYPDTWKERKFIEFLKIQRGASPRPIEKFITTNADGVNWIKIGDGRKNNKYITSTAEKITPEGQLCSVSVFAGDFLLSNSMSFGRPYILALDGCIHDGWLRLSEFDSEADSIFLYYLLSSPVVQRQYESLAAGSGVQNLNKDIVKNVIVHLPEMLEQKEIADALSQFDELIANFDELIEKKRNIRIGLIEDLVSGDTHLAGYEAKWAEAPIGELGCFIKGAPLSKSDLADSGSPLILYGELYTSYEEVAYQIRSKTKAAAPNVCYSKKGDVVIPTSGETAEEIATATCVMRDGVILAGDLNIFRSALLEGRFFSYAVNHIVNEEIAKIAQGSSIIHVNAKELSRIVIRYPSIDEQTAISNVIETTTTEITALEEERDKMIQIRDGAMDDLLTGRIRLDFKGGCHA